MTTTFENDDTEAECQESERNVQRVIDTEITVGEVGSRQEHVLPAEDSDPTAVEYEGSMEFGSPFALGFFLGLMAGDD